MRFKSIILVFLVSILCISNAFAFINCQPKYDNDKRALPSLKGSCGVCHINPTGSGPQNAFGTAFKQAGFKITDELVAQFPNLFKKPDVQPTPPLPSGQTSSGGIVTATSPPVIKRIKPKAVKANLQAMASIIGQNFVSDSKALIDNNEVLTTFKSKVLLLIDFVLNSTSVHEVKVKNPDEQESNVVKLMAK